MTKSEILAEAAIAVDQAYFHMHALARKVSGSEAHHLCCLRLMLAQIGDSLERYRDDAKAQEHAEAARAAHDDAKERWLMEVQRIMREKE